MAKKKLRVGGRVALDFLFKSQDLHLDTLALAALKYAVGAWALAKSNRIFT